MHTLFKQFVIRMRRLSLPLWSFFPGVAETLIRLPSTSPFTAAPEDPLTRNTLSTWLVVALAAVWLRLKERRARMSGSASTDGGSRSDSQTRP